MTRILLVVEETCPDCWGTKIMHGNLECQECMGKGRVRRDLAEMASGPVWEIEKQWNLKKP